MEAVERLDSSVLDALDLFKAEPKDVDLMDVGGLADIFETGTGWEELGTDGDLRGAFFDFHSAEDDTDHKTQSSNFTEASVGDAPDPMLLPTSNVAPTGHDLKPATAPAKKKTGQTKEKRRRRRTRNAKQQELNRLAQQRYRERKKQKYTDLQSTVDLLAEKLEAVRVLEEEKAQLLQQNGELQHKLTQRELIVSEQSNAMSAKQQKLATLQKVAKDQQLQLSAQAKKLKQQEAVISGLKDKLESTMHSACNLVDAGNVCDKLALAIKTALLNVKDAKSVQQALSQLELPENLLQQISQTICTCCQEMCLQLNSKPDIKPPTAIQVTCC